MKAFRWAALLAFLLAAACSKPIEPGLYRVRVGAADGFLRAGTDSLGNETFLFYADTGSVYADTVTVGLKTEKRKLWISFPDGREEKVTLNPYEFPEFHRFPDSDLYLLPQFEVGETKDVVFGRVLRDADKDREFANLTMDLYYPKNDRSVTRPLLMTFHEGAFLEGDKRDTSLVEWNRYFASLGYVVSSVNYRVGHHRNQKESDDAMYRALKDANAAVRFLLKRDSLLIHSDRIFAAGADAGAITALNLAYMREENLPEIIREQGDSVVVVRQTLLRGFDIRAVANLWGAIPDTTLFLNADIPVISFQSVNDPVMPFWTGYPYEEQEEEPENILDFFKAAFESLLSIFLPDIEMHPFREMYGAGVIDRVLKELGTQHVLYTSEEEMHNLFLKEDGSVDYPMYDEIKEQTARFFASKMETSPVSLRQDPEDAQLFLIDNSEVDVCQWNVEGGVIIGRSDDTMRILLFPDAESHSVSVSGAYTSGLTFFETVTL